MVVLKNAEEPAPAGEFAVQVEADPAGVHAAVAGIAARSGCEPGESPIDPA